MRAEELLLRLPPSWELFERRGDGISVRHLSGLGVIVSVAKELDGKRWMHVSLSYRNRLPSYTDLVEAKNLFIGEEKTAYQVFPAKEKHINIHPYCLHLWHCLDGDPLPDFTHGGDSI